MKLATITALTFIGASAFVTSPLVYAAGITQKAVEATFEDVQQDLSNAIINRGYKIDYRAFIGDMLARTASDVGGKKAIYKKAEFLQFCSAVLSRDAMEADPANIAFCPYVLFVYERVDEPGKVHVGFRRLDETGSEASKAALTKINAVLDEIVSEAADQ